MRKPEMALTQKKISTAIDGLFNGFCPQSLYKFQDGTFWLQIDSKMLIHHSVEPAVEILELEEGQFLKVEGLEKIVQVKQLHDVIESNIRGNFSGWSGKTAYTLTNGQTWQQVKFQIKHAAKYMPGVLIYHSSHGPIMHVADTSVAVRRIK